ncbi:MAG: AsmA-like C-terminal domain-containing protein [Alphaproteobacteria bacterium]|nr:AsmA-like C-terminal domain-containing protein [Alphaproteobacteria bacterium]
MGMLNKKKYLARRITDYVGTAIFAFLLIFIWQLYRSPIPLPFLKPYIIKALNHDSQEYAVAVESVNLELVRSIQPIKIIAREVEYKNNKGSISINAPRIEISFSVRALIRGIISPSSVVFDSPSVSVFTNYGETDKSSEMSLNEKKIGYYFDTFNRFIERFNSQDLSYPESYINYIAIQNGDFEFHEVDLNRNWNFVKANYVFDRDREDINIGIDGNLMMGEEAVPLDFDLKYMPKVEKVDIDLAFSNFLPSKAVEAFISEQEQAAIYKVDVPINGKLDILVDFKKVLQNKNNISKSLDTAVEDFKFRFEGDDGKIAFSDNEAFNYDIKAFSLSGEVDSGLNEIKISDAQFDMGEKSTSLSLYISGFKNLLLKSSMKDLKITLKTEVEKMNFSELPRYWPRYIAEDAWIWVKEGIYEGEIKDAAFAFEFAYDAKQKGLAFKNLSGEGKVENASLNYLEGMPHAHKVFGKATFYNDKIDIKIDKGESVGNKLTDGRVILYDLDKYDNFIDIQLSATSSIPDALKLIDSPPLEFASEMGIKPDDISGKAEINLKLDFELKKTLTPEEVKVAVQSKLSDVTIKNIIKDKIIKGDRLDLSVNNKEMVVRGDVVIDELPMNLVWQKPFMNNKYLNKYELSFDLNTHMKKKLGFDFDILKAPYFIGDTKIKANVLEVKTNKFKVNFASDLLENEINYAFLGFLKEKGVVGSLNFSVDVENDKVKKINEIKLTKEDFEVEASMDLNKKGEIETIDITKVKGPKTSAKAKVMMSKVNGQELIKVNISGLSYDISNLFEINIKSNEKTDLDPEEYLKQMPNTDINIAVDSLWTNKEVPVTNFAGNMKIRNKIGIDEIKMVGNFAYVKDSNFRFEYLPREQGEHLINVTSSDAGKALKILRLYDYMNGGDLKISALKEKDGKIVGHAKIRSFNILNTSLLAKVVSMASLTGIINTLSGEGIAFSHLDVPFEFDGSVIEMKEAKAFGNVLGISANGYYDYDTSRIKLGGMLAPAYSINRFLAGIPLVGRLLSGKDGTVFAASYRVSGDAENPKIKVDPLSAISPNSIKEMFSKDEN